jgi:hypothetical protein
MPSPDNQPNNSSLPVRGQLLHDLCISRGPLVWEGAVRPPRIDGLGQVRPSLAADIAEGLMPVYSLPAIPEPDAAED